VPVMNFRKKCPYRRQSWPKLVSFLITRRSRRDLRLWLGTNCLLLILICGCTPRPQDADPPPASALPMTFSAVETAAPPRPVSLHRRSADKKGQHKVHRIKSPELVAAVEPGTLIGKEPSAVEKLLGSPTGVSKKDVSLVWTYGSPDCAFQVYFYPDIKTSTFHALQYVASRHDGEKIDLGQECIQRLLIARK